MGSALQMRGSNLQMMGSILQMTGVFYKWGGDFYIWGGLYFTAALTSGVPRGFYTLLFLKTRLLHNDQRQFLDEFLDPQLCIIITFLEIEIISNDLEFDTWLRNYSQQKWKYS